jgi:hypothetical protein
MILYIPFTYARRSPPFSNLELDQASSRSLGLALVPREVRFHLRSDAGSFSRRFRFRVEPPMLPAVVVVWV